MDQDRLEVRPIRYAEVFASPDAESLLEEYAVECSIPLVGKVNPQQAMYEAMEKDGRAHCLGAFAGEKLVGFGSLLMAVLPHYGKKTATVESLFLAKESRNGWAGKNLLTALEDCAAQNGCEAIFYSAPSGGSLEKLLSLTGVSQTNAVFCKKLDPIQPCLPATAPGMIEKLKDVQEALMQGDQAQIFTQHLIHGGMYTRTITMPPHLALVGAHIKVPTVVITVGAAKVLVGREWADINGYQVLPASKDRKQIFVSLDGPLIITSVFPTQAKTVEEAEKEFTDEYDILMSRWQDLNEVVMTGE